MEVLTFRAARSLLGVPMEDVQEIVDSPSITPLPLLPAEFRGVTSVRGTPVAVVDLECARPKTMIVLHDAIALLADRIENIVDVEHMVRSETAPPWVSGLSGDLQIVDARRFRS